MNSKSNNRYYSIDSLRIIASFLVVCIHTIGYDGKDELTFVGRIAVPLFFMISGFFLYHPDQHVAKEKVKKSIRRITKLYVFVLSLSCFYAIWYCEFIEGSFQRCVWGPWKLFVWLTGFSQPLSEISGYGGRTLWFLQALDYSLVLLFFSLRYVNRVSPTIRIAGALFLLFVWTYINYRNNQFFFPFAKLFLLVYPYMILGYSINEIYNGIVMKWGTFTLITSLVIMGLLYVDFCYENISNKIWTLDNYYALPYMVFLMFIFALKNPQIGGRNLAKIGQNCAVWIYCFHGLMITIINNHFINISSWLAHPASIFFVTLILSIPFNVVNRKLKIL